MSERLGRILIVGGGIAGLTLAGALHRRGLDAEIVEREAGSKPVGAGIAVQPNGMRVLRGLGLAGAVERAGSVIRRWLLRAPGGEDLCAIDLPALWGEVGPFIGIERARLHEALLSGAAAVPCRRGIAVTSLRQDSGRVSVGFSGGTTGEYGLVVGADGVGSTVRRLAVDGAPPVYGGQMVWRSLAPLGLRERDSLQFWLGEGCFFGLCPVGDGLVYGFGNVVAPRVHDTVQGRLERLRRRFAAFGGAVRDYLAHLDGDAQIHCAPIEWLEPGERWHAGRVVLIGDAAHASSPMMGQGGCMAMEDACVLADLLREQPTPAALDAYVARRRPRVEWVQRESRAIGESFRQTPNARDARLRERGSELFPRRFAPLVAVP